jgi:hypothetical protein
MFELYSITYNEYVASPKHQSTYLRTKSGTTQISVRSLLGYLHEPLVPDPDHSTFCEVRGNSETFCLHVGNMKFNTRHEE